MITVNLSETFLEQLFGIARSTKVDISIRLEGVIRFTEYGASMESLLY